LFETHVDVSTNVMISSAETARQAHDLTRHLH